MNITKGISLLEYLGNFDLKVCCYCNRHADKERIRRLFAIVSRLGDGLIWYVLMAILPLVFGLEATFVSLRMAGAALAGLLIYKLIKSITERPRPYVKSETITLGTPPLDQYSFPSGHTLHAVSFSLIAMHYFPSLTWVLAPFALLVAMSRVVLGLHYPTDVLAGALIGFGLAMFFVSIF